MMTTTQNHTDTACLLTFMKVLSEAEIRHAWLRKVAIGEWGQIPCKLPYRDADKLAMLVDGYGIAKFLIEMHYIADPSKCKINSAGDISRSIFEIRRIEGRWYGTAAELWVALFLSKRADHFRIDIDNNDTNTKLDGLCEALRTALIDGRIWPPTRKSFA